MIRTRFAPSPTGFLHIGGVRTALFNWLFARAHGGRFVLRIDDTDSERNVEQALQPILHGFRWLGIEWDEGPEVGGVHGPYYQSQRGELYRAAVEKLIAAGAAYRDYATAEELAEEREAAQQSKERFLYSRRFMADSEARARKFEAEGRQAVVRLMMPREGVCRIKDEIRGEVEFEWAREQDHVIQRADGSCLYNLANVVDDQAMQITHVVRAEEHLSNTPRQIFIAQGLGIEPPIYAHLPFVAEPGSKNKLSKRKLDKYLKHPDFAKLNEHGRRIADAIGLATTAETFNPVIVDFYEQVGFLPEAVVNYLLLLGWALDDKTEIFSRDEMVKHFTLARVNKAAASFDPAKLLSFQERYMNALSTERKLELTLPYLERAGRIAAGDERARRTTAQIVEAAGDRIKVAGDILDYPEFFVADEALAYDEQAFDKRLRNDEGAAALLRRFQSMLREAAAFDASAVEAAMGAFLAAEGIKIGQIVHAVRIAVSGKAVGFGMWETLSILGRERCLARIERALARI